MAGGRAVGALSRCRAVQVEDAQALLRLCCQLAPHGLELVIHEGRNRQVRRMTAAVGLPTLRLVRVAVGPHRLDGLQPGRWRQISDH